MWKKSERHEYFTQQATRVGRKKFNLQSGNMWVSWNNNDLWLSKNVNKTNAVRQITPEIKHKSANRLCVVRCSKLFGGMMGGSGIKKSLLISAILMTEISMEDKKLRKNTEAHLDCQSLNSVPSLYFYFIPLSYVHGNSIQIFGQTIRLKGNKPWIFYCTSQSVIRLFSCFPGVHISRLADSAYEWIVRQHLLNNIIPCVFCKRCSAVQLEEKRMG